MSEAPEWSNTDKDAVQSLTFLTWPRPGISRPKSVPFSEQAHAVPNVHLVLGKRIGQVLAENDMTGTYPEDAVNLMRQAAIINHLGSNPTTRTFPQQASAQITEAKIRRLASYYIGPAPSQRLAIQA